MPASRGITPARCSAVPVLFDLPSAPEIGSGLDRNSANKALRTPIEMRLAV